MPRSRDLYIQTSPHLWDQTDTPRMGVLTKKECFMPQIEIFAIMLIPIAIIVVLGYIGKKSDRTKTKGLMVAQ